MNIAPRKAQQHEVHMQQIARPPLTKTFGSLTALLLTFSLLISPAAGAPAAQPAEPPIRLKAAQFTPARGERPAIPPGLTIAGYAQGQRGYYLVQFRGPVEQAWKDAAAASGAELLDYVPDFAFKARMNPAEAARVAQLPEVLAVEVFQPAFKISPNANRNSASPLRVRVENGADAGLAASEIAATGATILGREGQNLLVAADAAQIDAIARVLDVAWIENFVLREKHNETGAGSIVGTAAANSSGYDGSSQIAAVADTGLGGGTATSAHPDIPSSRIVSIRNWPGSAGGCFQSIQDDGAIDVDSGHGTHVAGSVLSDGGPAGEGRGGAPAARLVFQATENYAIVAGICRSLYGYTDGYYLTGIPTDLRQLFQQAYNDGARIHANSWGSDVAGDYTADSAYADQFVWSNKDMTITFSAGNAGKDANSNGVVDNDSIGSPATAKNVITIGASENQRADNFPCDTSLTYTSRDAYQTGQTCATMGGTNVLGTWGGRYPDRFAANPIASDVTAGNQEQMAGWSSRGPTDDSRIKPDVVAPGVWILSTYSQLHREGYGDPVNPKNGAYQVDGYGLPYNSGYKYFGGTSMSNPVAAGAATVVRDYYQKARSTSASAALVKATLINSAVDLQDENNDGANDNDFPIPNVHEGWGRVNLGNVIDGGQLFVDQASGLATNGVRLYDAGVTAAGPLKISVVWSDYASTETASVNLVNDLDVTVTSPTGTVYRGNVFSGGWSATAGSADRRNNVENVYVQAAGTGTWKIEVRGFNVPNGPQPFALVVDGAATLAEVAPPPPTTPAAPTGLTATAASRSRINLSWVDNSSNETGFKIERCTGAGCTNFAQIATVGANVTSYANTGLSRNTTYTYRVRANNSAGDSAYSNTASATTPQR
jgi:subtilisin family serine protease